MTSPHGFCWAVCPFKYCCLNFLVLPHNKHEIPPMQTFKQFSGTEKPKLRRESLQLHINPGRVALYCISNGRRIRKKKEFGNKNFKRLISFLSRKDNIRHQGIHKQERNYLKKAWVMVHVSAKQLSGDPDFLYNTYLQRPTLKKAAASPGHPAYLQWFTGCYWATQESNTSSNIQAPYVKINLLCMHRNIWGLI